MARIGGDEFVLLCPATDKEQAKVLIDRAIAITRKSTMEFSGRDGVSESIPIRFSVGIEDAKDLKNDIKAALSKATKALELS